MSFFKTNIQKFLKKFLYFKIKIKNKYLRFKLAFQKLIKKKFVKSVYGVYLKGNYNDVTFRLCILGSYGDFYFKRLKGINSNFVFVDIGANQGLYSIIASQNSKNMKSYVFEPVPKTFSLLKENLIYNNVYHKCIAFQKAISNEVGISKITLKSNHSGSATISSGNKLYNNSNNSIDVSLIDSNEISNLIKEKNYPIYVKIDVEGHEKIVINELIKANFFDRVKEIFFEVDNNWVDLHSIKESLLEKGFYSFKKIGSGNHFDILAERK